MSSCNVLEGESCSVTDAICLSATRRCKAGLIRNELPYPN